MDFFCEAGTGPDPVWAMEFRIQYGSRQLPVKSRPKTVTSSPLSSHSSKSNIFKFEFFKKHFFQKKDMKRPSRLDFTFSEMSLTPPRDELTPLLRGQPRGRQRSRRALARRLEIEAKEAATTSTCFLLPLPTSRGAEELAGHIAPPQ